MDEIFRVVILPLLLMAAIIWIFYFFFGRRRDARQDPPGLRCFATFRAPRALLAEHAGDAVDDADPSDAGATVLEAIAAALAERAVIVREQQAENYGHSAEAAVDDETFLLRLGWIGGEDEAGTPCDWLLSLDPPSGRTNDTPGLRKLLAASHDALHAIGASHRRWHRREDWIAGTGAGAASPID